MERFKKHLETYLGCTRCELHQNRKYMVFTRGTVPCDVVFVGEAPGESEDSIGQPFVGPAGIDELDPLLNTVFPSFPTLTYCLTNLVCCIPLNEQGTKTAEPDGDCIEACAPRLRDFIRICDPKLIVTLGNLARDWLDTKYKKAIRFHRVIPQLHLVHPAAIVRANVTQRGLMRQRSMVALQEALETLLESQTEGS